MSWVRRAHCDCAQGPTTVAAKQSPCAQPLCLPARPCPFCPSILVLRILTPASTRAESATAGLAQTTDSMLLERVKNLLEPGPNDNWDWYPSQLPAPRAGAGTCAHTRRVAPSFDGLRASRTCVQGHHA